MSKHGDYSGLRFCPRCGLERLEFDRYRERKSIPAAEYVCGGCGFGFRIQKSARVEDADLLFKRSRQVRVGKFHEGIAPEVAEAFLEHTEKRHERWYRRMLRRGTLGKFLNDHSHL
jgi:rubredoxin